MTSFAFVLTTNGRVIALSPHAYDYDVDRAFNEALNDFFRCPTRARFCVPSLNVPIDAYFDADESLLPVNTTAELFIDDWLQPKGRVVIDCRSLSQTLTHELINAINV